MNEVPVRSRDRISVHAHNTKEITALPIEYAYDSISVPGTQQMVYDFLANDGTMVIVLDQDIANIDSASGKKTVRVVGSPHLPRNKGKPYAHGLFVHATRLLASGELKSNRVRVLTGGLEGIADGFTELEKGVSRVKLVAHPQE